VVTSRLDIPQLAPGVVPAGAQQPLERVQQEVRRLMGFTGDPLDMAVTFRDLQAAGMLTLGANVRPGSGQTPGVIVGGGSSTPGPPGPIGPVGPAGTTYVPDLTPPPNLTGLTATATFHHVIVEWAVASYSQGHGPGTVRIYAALRAPAAANAVFGDAVLVYEAPHPLTIAAIPSVLNTRWHIWATFVTVDGVESPAPTGGTNGFIVTTGKVGNADLGALIVEAGNLATGAVTASKLAAASVGLTAFAAGIEPVSLVSAVPGSFVTNTVFNTSDGKLYRWNGSAYVATFPAGDLTGQIGTTQIAPNAITTPLLSANAVTAAILAADSVIAGKVAAGAINTRELAAQAVRTDKLLVTGIGPAINDDPNTVDASAWAGGTFAIVADTSSPTGSALAVTSVSATTTSLRRFPVDPTKNYNIRINAKQHSGTSIAYLFMAFYDASGALLDGSTFPSGWSFGGTYHYFGLVGQQPPSSYTEYRVSFGPDETRGIPAGARSMQVGVLGNYTGSGEQRFTGFRLYEKANADLIVDGSIIATKLAANAIAVGTLAVQNGAIVNAMIGNLAVDDAKIVNMSVAKLVAGSLNVGAFIQSTNYVPNNAGWHINGNGGAEFGFGMIRGTLLASQVVASFVTTTMLAAGSVTAGKISVTSLDAISATIGLLRTATTGARQEIASNYIKVFDASNVKRVQLGDLTA
jgi:hypothetical protein